MKRTLRLVLFAAPILALTVAALFLTLGSGGGNKAHADFPHAGLNFSIGSASPACDSDGASTCIVPAGVTITINFNVSATGGVGYQGYDSLVQYTGLTLAEASLVQSGAGAWPGCVFAAHAASPGQLAAACGFGIGAQDSTYTGVMWHADFTCPASAPANDSVLTLKSGAGNSDLLDATSASHGEGADETLNVTCGHTGGGVTDTPVGPTNTPTNTVPPTNTSVPTTPATATNTPTRTNTPVATATHPVTPTPAISKCDVDGDHHITSTDALWLLWKDAHTVVQVPLPENADCNHDGRQNSIDALFILWIAGGRLPAPH